MIDLLFDLYQQKRINDVEDTAQESGRKATDFQERVRQLEESVARLALVNAALWSLVKDKTGLTDAALTARMRDIDLRDGVEDGKITTTVQNCQKCGRTMAPRHKRCLYCGGERLASSPFAGI
jgi:rRNA maturation endonuclease Nob1